MKKSLSPLLALLMCLYLCACSQEDTEANGAYDDLIAAIESDNYDRALRELQDLMDIEPTQPPEQPTDPPACTHRGPSPTCTENAYCNQCGELLSEALGHKYAGGICTRCGTADPADKERQRAYKALMDDIQYFEKTGYVYPDNSITGLTSSAAVEYIYEELTKLGDYSDCAQYLERITIVPDKLLYIKMEETDNLGNKNKGTDLNYEYDAQGRVIMSEDAAFLNQLGVFRNTYASGFSQYYVTITYGDDGRIAEYRLYFVGLREIITPTYDENGRMQSAYHQENEGGYTTYFSYDDQGRLIKVWNDANDSAIYYAYNPDGTLASKICDADTRDIGFEDITKEYLYDENGTLTGWKSESVVPTVECDAQGRILREQIVESDGVAVYEYFYGDYYLYTPPSDTP